MAFSAASPGAAARTALESNPVLASRRVIMMFLRCSEAVELINAIIAFLSPLDILLVASRGGDRDES